MTTIDDYWLSLLWSLMNDHDLYLVVEESQGEDMSEVEESDDVSITGSFRVV